MEGGGEEWRGEKRSRGESEGRAEKVIINVFRDGLWLVVVVIVVLAASLFFWFVVCLVLGLISKFEFEDLLYCVGHRRSLSVDINLASAALQAQQQHGNNTPDNTSNKQHRKTPPVPSINIANLNNNTTATNTNSNTTT